MARSEQEVIDALFSRLREAEEQTGERDAKAQERIDAHVRDQPGAPYYMAQTIVVQEAAIKRLNARVEALEKQKSEKRSSGGFLAGIFGGGQSEESPIERGRRAPASSGRPAASGPGQNWQTNGPAGAMRGGGGSGFLGGALQTAAGVAGGMMLGNMLMGMFGHHNSEEIAEVIEDPVGTDSQADQVNDMDSGDTGTDQGGFEPASYDPQDDAPLDDGGFQDDSSFFGGDAGGLDDFDEL